MGRPKKEAAVEPKEVPAKEEKTSEEVMLEMSEFFRDYQKIGRTLDVFMTRFKRWKFDLIQTLAREENAKSKIRDAQIELGKIEEEAQTRLESVEMGHRELMEKLTQQNIDLKAQQAKAEKAEADAGRLKVELEARIAAVNRQASVKKEISDKIA